MHGLFYSNYIKQHYYKHHHYQNQPSFLSFQSLKLAFNSAFVRPPSQKTCYGSDLTIFFRVKLVFYTP